LFKFQLFFDICNRVRLLIGSSGGIRGLSVAGVEEDVDGATSGVAGVAGGAAAGDAVSRGAVAGGGVAGGVVAGEGVNFLNLKYSLINRTISTFNIRVTVMAHERNPIR
jgi:hypothetical protein